MRLMSRFLAAFVILVMIISAVNAQTEFSKRDYFVTSEPDIKIHVREVAVNSPAKKEKSPLLLVHGGGGAGVASFDVEVAGYSLAEDFAKAGHEVYLMDVRGYGSSSTVRLPNGFQREAYEMSLGKKIFDAAEIRVPTLVIRGELCHWSRPEDITALENDLKNAPRKKLMTIPGGTHFLFIDRPERGRDIFMREVTGFLQDSK